MAWVTLATVSAADQNGGAYYLQGVLQYESAQDVPNLRTKMRIIARQSRGGGASGRVDYDSRAWGVSVAAVAAASGGGSASGNTNPDFYTRVAAGSTYDLATSSEFWINHKADGTAQITASASWDATSSGSWFDSGFSGSFGATSLPTIILKPNAPTSVVATRNSDTSIGLAWTPNPASGKPYSGQSVMVSIDGAAPVLVANVTAVTASYTYTASANHKYIFTVVASNAAGSTTSANSNIIITTPDPLSSLSAALVTSGTIRLTLPVRPTPHTDAQLVITETHDGGTTWNAKTTIAASSLSTTTPTTWDDTAAQTGGTVQYRAIVRTTSGTQGVLSSSAAVSNILVLNTPPNAPTNLSPSGPVDASLPLRLAWAHNPSSDGASQSSRRIQYSTDGGSTQTTIASGNTTTGYYDWSPVLGSFAAGQTILWRVATAGSVPGTYGAWSAWQSLTLYGSLAVVLAAGNPPTSHAGGPLPVQWTSSPTWGAATQAQYRVTMVDLANNQTVFDTGMVAGLEQSVSIPSNVQANNRNYRVTVTLVDNHIITSQPATRDVHTDYLAPGPVALDWFYDDETGSLVVSPTFSDETSSAFDDTHEWALERSLDGTSWARVGSVVGPNPITDVLVRLGMDSYYRGVPTTTLGVSGDADEHTVPAADVTSRWGWINYGDHNQQRVRFGWSQTVEVASGRASESYDIEGMQYPVAVFGGNRSRKMSVSGKLLSGAIPVTLATASPEQMIDAQETAGVVMFRDARGAWWPGRLSDMKVSPLRTKTGQPDEAPVSFTLERVSA